MRRLLTVLVAAVSLVVLLGADAARAANGSIHITSGGGLDPASVTVNRGDSVTWLWRDGETEHNVTFRGFHSHTQASGSYTVKFTHRGTFKYRCTIHEAEGMRGKVIVH